MNSHNSGTSTTASPAQASCRRRWPRFRLRTMLVLVTLLAIPLAWVAHSLCRIRERHQYLSQHESLFEATVRLNVNISGGRQFPASVAAPGGLWLLGEQGVARLTVSDPSEKEAAGRLFPEAELVDR